MAIRSAAQALLLVHLTVFMPTSARAEISEPDNILYGTIVIDNQPVTATRTDVVIEARRLLSGPAIASYRMGSNPAVGNFYSLRLPVEAVTPVTLSDASQVGDSVIIVVVDNSGVRGQTTYLFPERGAVQRADFGTTVIDADGNGLPDLWELSRYGAAGQDPEAINPNGLTTLGNYLAGTDPNDLQNTFKVEVSLNSGQTSVSFFARRAEGAGYEGRTRFYSLESRAGIGSPWYGVSAATNLLGNNQTIAYQFPMTNSPMFFRAGVRLD
jgi:hypothetical protein